jgi:hypothetical protein
MAGTIIADKIQTENSFLTLNVGQTLVATINSSGILNSSGGIMVGANGSVSNTAITGVINGSQLASPLSLTGNVSLTGNLSFDSTGTSGMRLPAANTLAFYTTGTEDIRITSNGWIGVGTTTPANTFTVKGTGIVAERSNDTDRLTMGYNSFDLYAAASGAGNHNTWAFRQSNNTETKRRIEMNSGGNITFFGNSGTQANNLSLLSTTDNRYWIHDKSSNDGAGFTYHVFQHNSSGVGSISYNGTGTSFNSTSDYRLKNNIVPLTNALDIVSNLKPKNYVWKETGEIGRGFIAHELQEVFPEAVIGEKDDVDENGKPIYQGIDTSFLVATLTAAIQEQQAIIFDLKARIEALEA